YIILGKLGLMWATPITTYFTALVLKFLPLTEVNIRLSTVLVGVGNIFLLWLIAKKFFSSQKWAYVAAIILALSPAHFINSRLLLDNLYSTPFLLGWLYCLQLFLEKQHLKYLLWGGLILGLGVHSYHAAKITMPIYLLMTLVVAVYYLKKRWWQGGGIILAFLLPLIPLFFWLKIYPDTLSDQVRYTNLYSTQLSATQGILTLLTPSSLLSRAQVFLNYFHPGFLFFRGDNSLIHSTHQVGVFLWPLLIFLPFGLYQLRKKATAVHKIILLGFFSAPLAATIAGDNFRISRILVMLPFAALAATLGFKTLWSKKGLWRLLCLGLVICGLIQFTFFLNDYFRNYPLRSYKDFRYNIPGALESVIKQEGNFSGQTIYLDKRVEFIDRYWKFYLLKHHRLDLLPQTVYLLPDLIDTDKLNSNSILLLNYNNVDGLKENLGSFRKINTILEPDKTSSFYIYTN
ncbi:MAG: glycosyltransferase family 39 protein, partial [Patescibacteria group bacterium]|nr:glycosyltransferase family 39 protein [Patescibacteria group bacterium]